MLLYIHREGPRMLGNPQIPKNKVQDTTEILYTLRPPHAEKCTPAHRDTPHKHIHRNRHTLQEILGHP